MTPKGHHAKPWDQVHFLTFVSQTLYRLSRLLSLVLVASMGSLRKPIPGHLIVSHPETPMLDFLPHEMETEP